MDYEWVRRSLEVLKHHLIPLDQCTRSGVWNWGASITHRYELGQCLTEREISAFESLHSIHLPTEYRDFLMNLGNGGAGPGYGVFPLGKMSNGWGNADFDYDYVGCLSRPFPHSSEWRCTEAATEWDEHTPNLEEGQDVNWNRRCDAHFNPKYIDGAIPLSDLGCGQTLLLVVTGAEKGNLWHDDRPDHVGISPISLNGQRVRFNQWYTDWLIEALKHCSNGTL